MGTVEIMYCSYCGSAVKYMHRNFVESYYVWMVKYTIEEDFYCVMNSWDNEVYSCGRMRNSVNMNSFLYGCFICHYEIYTNIPQQIHEKLKEVK